MKKTLISLALVAGVCVSGAALAAETVICPATVGATAAGPGTAPARGTAGEHFMVTAIAPKCSANTNVAGVDGTSGAWYAVGANSVKGRTNFGGHTNGGAVVRISDCAVAGGCTAGESVTARDAADTAAASASPST